MSTYQSTVEAQRFDLDRVDELAKWCGGRKISSSDGWWIIVGQDTAVPGDYIVKTARGEFTIASEKEFLELYHIVGGTEDREYVLARLLANAEVSVPEIHLPQSAFAEGYTVELGEHRFTQSQWEAIQLYASGVARAAEETKHQESLEKFFQPDEYVGDLSRLVFEALGAVSACWDNLEGAGTFESTRARAIGEELLDGIRAHFKGHKAQRQNRDFHEAMGIFTARSPRAIPLEDVPVVMELIREEFIDELIPALGARVTFTPDGKFDVIARGGEPNVVEIYDALIDILYVTYGALNRAGMDAEPGYDEVQASNMSKLGEDGKAIIAGPNDPDGIFPGRVKKGPNYFKPDLARVLNELAFQADVDEDPLAHYNTGR